MRAVQPRRAALIQSATRGPSRRFWPYFRLSRPSLWSVILLLTFALGEHLKLSFCCPAITHNLHLWRGGASALLSWSTVTATPALGWEKTSESRPWPLFSSPVFLLFTSSALRSLPSEANLPKSNNDLCAHVFRRPPGAFAKLRTAIRRAQSCSQPMGRHPACHHGDLQHAR